MTYKELKEFIGSLNEEQLEQEVIVFIDDEETGKQIDSWEISQEEIYWERHGDCLGNLEEAKSMTEDWEDVKEDLIIVPKGFVSLNCL